MKYRDLVKQVMRDGWYLRRTSGSHEIYKHPVKPGTVVIAYHGQRDIPLGTAKEILRQAGLE